MSTATIDRKRKAVKVRITVNAVRAALEEIAAAHPARVDRTADPDQPARYVKRGAPNCLVAMALAKLGFNVGVLGALDAEHPAGDLFSAGVRVAESRHPALRKVDDQAKALLQWVQDQQDAGKSWGRVVAAAFKPRRLWPRAWDMRRRPWLYG